MITLSDLLAATAGQMHGPIGATTFESFCFDSRVIRPGQLFLAVKTEHADGHDYIADACAGGAIGVLCQHPIDTCATCIVVPDTRQAIQDWARFILAKQQVEIIGITGSVGKTTAKEAIAAVLGAVARIPLFSRIGPTTTASTGCPSLSASCAPSSASLFWRWRRITSARSAAWPGSHRPTSRW